MAREDSGPSGIDSESAQTLLSLGFYQEEIETLNNLLADRFLMTLLSPKVQLEAQQFANEYLLQSRLHDVVRSVAVSLDESGMHVMLTPWGI